MKHDDQILASRALGKRLAEQFVWREAKSILAYVPLSGEPNLMAVLEEGLGSGKKIALPRYDESSRQYEAAWVSDFSSDLQPGRFGVLEPQAEALPASLNQLDLVLVPGLAFDVEGRRLGRGKGFYDRLLGLARGVRCGVAFDEQVREWIPVEPHDVAMNYLVTPRRWFGVGLKID